MDRSPTAAVFDPINDCIDQIMIQSRKILVLSLLFVIEATKLKRNAGFVHAGSRAADGGAVRAVTMNPPAVDPMRRSFHPRKSEA